MLQCKKDIKAVANIECMTSMPMSLLELTIMKEIDSAFKLFKKEFKVYSVSDLLNYVFAQITEKANRFEMLSVNDDVNQMFPKVIEIQLLYK